MRQPVVVVAFSCQSGEIEKLALRAAVGAVQARALIRLRRLPDPDDPPISEELMRMRREYVPPTETDILGTDALVLVSSANSTPESAPWHGFLELLRRLHTEGKLDGRAGAAIGGLGPILSDLGFVTIPEVPEDPMLLGRVIAECARTSGHFEKR